MTDKMTPHEELMTPRGEFWVKRVGALMIVILSPFIAALIFFSWPDLATAFRWIIFFISWVAMMSGIFFLTQRIAIECPECKENIYSDEPWLCPQPSCTAENSKTTLFSFLGICKFCWKAPTAVSCYHNAKENVNCKGLIYLSRDKDHRWMAQSIMNLKKSDETVEDLDTEATKLSKKTTVEKSKKSLYDAEVERMRAEAQKEAVKESLKPKNRPEPQPRDVRLRADLNRRLADGVEAHNIAREAKRRIAEEFANDPNLKEMNETIIDNWLDEQSLK